MTATTIDAPPIVGWDGKQDGWDTRACPNCRKAALDEEWEPTAPIYRTDAYDHHIYCDWCDALLDVDYEDADEDDAPVETCERCEHWPEEHYPTGCEAPDCGCPAFVPKDHKEK